MPALSRNTLHASKMNLSAIEGMVRLCFLVSDRRMGTEPLLSVVEDRCKRGVPSLVELRLERVRWERRSDGGAAPDPVGEASAAVEVGLRRDSSFESPRTDVDVKDFDFLETGLTLLLSGDSSPSASAPPTSAPPAAAPPGKATADASAGAGDGAEVAVVAVAGLSSAALSVSGASPLPSCAVGEPSPSPSDGNMDFAVKTWRILTFSVSMRLTRRLLCVGFLSSLASVPSLMTVTCDNRSPSMSAPPAAPASASAAAPFGP
mmetsp:Transcript_144500/g.463043  ORF Transcript_144500/g.463043 Transcript_144500/m.463043 type:complete len:262 (+) Transcript_144500:495-1280(+)